MKRSSATLPVEVTPISFATSFKRSFEMRAPTSGSTPSKIQRRIIDMNTKGDADHTRDAIYRSLFIKAPTFLQR